MNETLRKTANHVVEAAINAVKPDEAVARALNGKEFPGRVFLIAAGKAGYQMAKAASGLVSYECGVVVTKYEHVMGEIPRVTCVEAGHPIPDENSFKGTQLAWDLTTDLTENDTVLFLLSGGGSALFEIPEISQEDLQDLTGKLLACGADITEINTIRKRLSKVKGGKFAAHVAPAKVYAVILSDILGDPVDMIASGPTVPDKSTSEDALRILQKYDIEVSEEILSLLKIETPKEVPNAEYSVIGSVKELCSAAGKELEALGYEVIFLTDQMAMEAREAGKFLGAIAKTHASSEKKLAFLAGGETVVHLKGTGLGGRNQEIACGAMSEIAGLHNTCVFSVGSDGTDGPTDAAGGYADGESLAALKAAGGDYQSLFDDNDCYHLLEKTGGLIITGPTGTNVNDFSVVLIN